MTKSQLRESIAEMDILSKQWVNFRKYFNPENITPTMESEFNQIKSDITSRHRRLLSILGFDIEIAQTMLESLGRINSPRGGELLTPTTRKLLEDEWNSAYLLVQETIGLLEYQLEEKSISTLFHGSQKKSVGDQGMSSPYRGRSERKKGVSPIVKLIFIVILLGIVVAVLWQFNIIQDIVSGF